MNDADANRDWRQALYDKSAATLLLHGRALGLTHSEAEDVLHEVFLALMRLPSPPDRPDHYAFRAYRMRVNSHRRSWWRRQTREAEATRWFQSDSFESDGERRAMNALACLPIKQREVIVLKIWAELTFEAIGDLVGVSPNTAAGRYRYGIARLQQAMTAGLDNGENDENRLEPSKHSWRLEADEALARAAAASFQPASRS